MNHVLNESMFPAHPYQLYDNTCPRVNEVWEKAAGQWEWQLIASTLPQACLVQLGYPKTLAGCWGTPPLPWFINI